MLLQVAFAYVHRLISPEIRYLKSVLGSIHKNQRNYNTNCFNQYFCMNKSLPLDGLTKYFISIGFTLTITIT